MRLSRAHASSASISAMPSKLSCRIWRAIRVSRFSGDVSLVAPLLLVALPPPPAAATSVVAGAAATVA
jgi:hypothetical protein